MISDCDFSPSSNQLLEIGLRHVKTMTQFCLLLLNASDVQLNPQTSDLSTESDMRAIKTVNEMILQKRENTRQWLDEQKPLQHSNLLLVLSAELCNRSNETWHQRRRWERAAILMKFNYGASICIRRWAANSFGLKCVAWSYWIWNKLMQKMLLGERTIIHQIVWELESAKNQFHVTIDYAHNLLN